MNLEYFISSLPSLRYGQKSPVSEKDFRAACASSLDGEMARSVAQILDGGAGDSGTVSRWVRAWLDKDLEIRSAVARRRAKRLGLPAAGQLRQSASPDIESAVDAAFEEPDPLRRETALDRLRWRIADEMQGVQPLAPTVVFAYAAKLRLVLRREALDEAAGEAKFADMASSSLKDGR